MRAHLLVLAAMLALAGCHHGPSGETFPPARGHRGVTAAFALTRGRVTAEILAAEDSGLVLLEKKRVGFAPYRTIQRAVLRDVGYYSYTLYGGRRPDPERLARIRLVSRYPQGIPPELLARLLEAYGQQSVHRYDR